MRLSPLIIAVVWVSACAERIPPQKPDFSFWFRCQSRATLELELKIEAFLQQQGFRVLNLGALRREEGVALQDLNVVAIDSKKRTINVDAFKHTPGSQAVSLYSPPPTEHDTDLEEALLSFATSELGCTTDQVARNSNGPEAAEMHKLVVHRIEGWFEQASEYRRDDAQQVIQEGPP